jgi:hypothetical protein
MVGVVLASSLALSGCSTIKKFTGQRDDTVLPGAREDVLPPQKIAAPEQDPSSQNACPPIDPKCKTAKQGTSGTVQ